MNGKVNCKNLFMLQQLSNRIRKRLSSTAVRQGFGSFHSEDIEVLVRSSSVQLEQRLQGIRSITQEEIAKFWKDNDLKLLSSTNDKDKGKLLRNLFSLTPEFTFLNHGAFGGALTALSSESHRWRIECEKQPLRFFDRDLFPLMATSLQTMSKVLCCRAEDLLPLPNVTTGLNALTHTIHLDATDEIMLFSLTYGSTKKIVKDWALRTGATVKIVHLPLPVQSSAEILTRIGRELSAKTKVIIIDHITSNTAIQLPVKDIASLVKSQTTATVIVDAAHSLFSQPVQIHQASSPSSSVITNPSLHEDFENVDFWLSNAHKWLSAPKGAALLWTNPHTVHHIRPAIISHGFAPHYSHDANATLLSRGKFLSGFAWDGCRDYASFLTLPSAVHLWDAVNQQLQQSAETTANSAVMAQSFQWQHLRQRIQDTLATAEDIFQREWDLGTEDFPCPYTMRQNNPMRLIPLPAVVQGKSTRENVTDDDAFRIQEVLHHQHQIEVPIKCLEGRLYVRISAHIYNHPDEYQRLAHCIINL